MDSSLESIWSGWEIEKTLGRGHDGLVYQAVHREYGLEYRSAVKAVSACLYPADLASLRAEGMNEEEALTELNRKRDDILREIRIMQALKGEHNIVGIEDFRVVEAEGAKGWIIYIRMELLTPLNEWKSEHDIAEQDVIKLGIDLCNALEVCEKEGILHRDIKPENIFVDRRGSFKLGDFGISRHLEGFKRRYTQMMGTQDYIAPESVNESVFDHRSDLYSLGLVLYHLMNRNRGPFLSMEKRYLDAHDRDSAYFARLGGKTPMLPPLDASPKLAEIILKACAFQPESRYQSAAELRTALEWCGSISDDKSPARSSLRMWLKLGAALLACLVIGTVVWLSVGKQIVPGLAVTEMPEPVLPDTPEPEPELEIISEKLPDPPPEMGTDDEEEASSVKAVNEYWEKVKEAFRQGQYDTARQYLLLLVEEGDADAMYRMGYFYQHGLGVKQDYAEAMNWYEKSADNGFGMAMLNIGYMYFHALGVEQSYDKAFSWYQKAAYAGVASAKTNLGQMFHYGYGVDVDYKQAMEWYQKAADDGNVLAMNNIGALYEEGAGVEKDYQKALEWYTKSADGGNALAMKNIGDLYMYGYGVEQTYATAKHWYEKAAEKGNSDAMRMLGDLYYYGNGVNQDYLTSIEWYEKAYSAGNQYAQTAMGKAMLSVGNQYFDGEGVEINYAIAAEWYKKSANTGNSIGMYNCGLTYEVGGYGLIKNIETALEWYLKAANAGYTKAMLRLGETYESDGNIQEAIRWYESAAAQGDADAMFCMGTLYLHKDGDETALPYNMGKAMEWFRKAADAGHEMATDIMSVSFVLLDSTPGLEGMDASNLFDMVPVPNDSNKITHNTATKWCVDFNSEAYVEWYLPEAKQVYQLLLFTCSDSSKYAGSFPADWSLQVKASADDEWMEVYRKEVNDAETLQSLRGLGDTDNLCLAFDLKSHFTQDSFHFFRFVVTSLTGDSPNMQISGLSIVDSPTE